MSINEATISTNFGLLPEPEGRTRSFLTSAAVNLTILALVLYIGMMAKRVIEQHRFQQTELIFPTTPPPQPKVKVPPPPKLLDLPKPQQVKLEAPKLNLPKPEPKPVIKPVEMEAKVKALQQKAAKAQGDTKAAINARVAEVSKQYQQWVERAKSMVA